MAKISTYPNVGTPVLSDMLIGTDVTDSNATKNFMISDILGLISSLGLYVPYTGATANVNLGSFNLSAQDLTLSGDATFNGAVYVNDVLFDVTSSPGFAGQILTATGTGIQWVNISSLSLNLQQVLDDGNTANQDIILTGATNKIEQTGATSYIQQTGFNSYIKQTGLGTTYILQASPTAFISQSGLNAFISQSGNNASIQQSGSDSLIQQSGNNAAIKQSGSDAFIEQTGSDAFIEQTGSDNLIQQTGNNAAIKQSGTDSSITQIGVNAFISQAGSFSYIEQTGTNAYIEQTNLNAYIKPGQIKDSVSSAGTAGEVLSSLGAGLGVQWIAPLSSVSLGSFYDSNTQTTTIGVAKPMRFATDDIVGYGVSVTTDGSGNKTQIEVTDAGIYNVQFSAQLRNGAGASVVDIWFRKNGSDVASSNTSVSLQANTNEVASWNYFVSLVPGDKFQIMWTQDNNNAVLYGVGASAPHPATPSVILTVNRIR